MVPFSERCGYVKPRKALVREEINIDGISPLQRKVLTY
jgi:hypothetical protein